MTHAPMRSRATAGKVLCTLRQSRGLTGRALAERTGVDQSTLARAEAGALRLSPDALERVLHELDPDQRDRWAIISAMAWDHRYTRLL